MARQKVNAPVRGVGVAYMHETVFVEVPTSVKFAERGCLRTIEIISDVRLDITDLVPLDVGESIQAIGTSLGISRPDSLYEGPLTIKHGKRMPPLDGMAVSQNEGRNEMIQGTSSIVDQVSKNDTESLAQIPVSIDVVSLLPRIVLGTKFSLEWVSPDTECGVDRVAVMVRPTELEGDACHVGISHAVDFAPLTPSVRKTHHADGFRY